MLADVVRAHRRRLGLSQEELAEKAGVNSRTIGNIEAGRILSPRPATVRLLAAAFNLRGADRDKFCAAAMPPADPSEVPPPGVLVPRQLPAVTRSFVGRVDELNTLDTMAADSENARAIVISAIAGTAGIGKTALALHWAHRVADQFPDGQLYVNLRGFDASGTRVSPSEAIRGFLDALDVPARRIPATVDGQAALYRSVMADRRMLVLLDNARDTEHVRPLLPGSRNCVVVVTSRNRLTGLVAVEDARAVTLGLLSTMETEELLAQRLGRRRVYAEPEATSEIAEHCARLPLALAIVAARASAHPDFPLASLAAELRDARGRLDALGGDDSAADVRAVFSWSYDALDPDAARLFRLFGLHPGPDCTVAAAASLAGLPPPAIRPLLTELTRAHLLVEYEPGRYTSHDLLRAYAAELASRVEPEEERHAAVHRLLDHYLHTAAAADRLLDPSRNLIELDPPQPGAQPEVFADSRRAMAWFFAEHETLLALVDVAAAGWDTHTWQLAWSAATFMFRRGRWAELITTHLAALEATRRLGGTYHRGNLHGNIARAYFWLGRSDEALAHLGEALALATERGDLSRQANTHLALSNLWERRGNRPEAVHHTRQSLALYLALDDRRGQAVALNNVGLFHALGGEYERSLVACRQALALHEKHDKRDGQAAAWDNLGFAHHQLGDYGEAISCFRNALALLHELADPHHQAAVLVHLGDVHESAGDPAAAGEAWREALAILEETESPDADEVRDKLRQLP